MGLFDQLYDATPEAIKSDQKPFIERQVKRKLQSAYDDAINKAMTARKNIYEHRQRFQDYDVNYILEQKLLIERCDELQEMIKAENKELFDEDIK